MASEVKNIILLGSTGRLGKVITEALLNKKIFTVKLLVRKESQQKNKEIIDGWKAKGAIVVDGDVADINSVIEAAKGSDTLISTLGGSTLFSGAEVPLIQAAKAAGIKRFIPSQFGLDGEHLTQSGFMAKKDDTRAELKKAGLDYTIIVVGYWYEFAWGKWIGWDVEGGKVTIVGDGNRKFSTISADEVAKFVPEILADPSSKNQTIALEGQTITQNQAKAIFEQVTGKQLQAVHKSAEVFKKEIEEATGFNKFPPWALLQVVESNRALNFEGRSDNWRWPTVVTTSVREYAQKTYGAKH